MKICFHGFISGRVQGVFFRRESSIEAQKLGLTGWVHNTADDRVEIMICGEEDKINLMKDWLTKGPERAEVKEVQLKKVSYQDFNQFEVR